jgi:anti-sigma factor RsiW
MLKLVIGGQIYTTVEGCADECLIMAYIDGELDDVGRRYVENLLETSAEARRIADVMQLSTVLVKSAYPSAAGAQTTTSETLSECHTVPQQQTPEPEERVVPIHARAKKA